MISIHAEPTKEGKPSTGVAMLLAIVGPLGAGHFYLGQTRRAVLWLMMPFGLLVLVGLALPLLGGAFGYGIPFWGVFAGAALTWFASLVDVHLVPEERRRHVAGWKVIAFLIVGLVVGFGTRGTVRKRLLEAFTIPSAGMAPSVMPGDHIVADKLVFRARPPKRGEPIVFFDPQRKDQEFVQRVIAVPGDTLVVANGHPFVNGWQVPSCHVGTATIASGKGENASGQVFVEFLDGEAYLTLYDQSAVPTEQGPFAVSAGEIWVMGDNRNSSYDSRIWFGGRGGGVPLDLLIGRALFRWLNVSKDAVDWSTPALAQPRLPPPLQALEPALDACLAKRPPREQTVPPTR